MNAPQAQSSHATHELYLTTVDKFGRDPAGDSVVAGTSFRSLRGHPGLPFGCGVLRMIDPGLPRWLVVDATRAQRDGGLGGRVYEGSIVFDGSREGAVDYLHGHGAGNRPHLGLVREVGEAAVATAGPYSVVTGGPETVLAVGPRSRVTAGAGATVAGDNAVTVEAGEFAAVAASDQSSVVLADFGTAAVRQCGRVASGQAALLAGGPQSNISAGAGSVVLGGPNSVLDVGEASWAVGKIGSHFRGKDRAVFVAERRGSMMPVVAFVGADGLDPDVWYQADADGFKPAESSPASSASANGGNADGS